MRVAVLGSAGAMGSYFVEYFRRLGHTVAGSDVQRTGSLLQAGTVSSNLGAVRQADLVLLAVPLWDTLKVAREIKPALKRGCTLVEITSIKGTTLAQLEKIASSCDASLLSLHPMFGPSSRSKAPRILVVGKGRDLETARGIFKGAELTLVGAEDHDRLVAYALSLVHLTNLAFAMAVANGPGLKKLQKSAPPFASAQLDLVKAVLLQGPELYFYIDTMNRSVTDALSSTINELSTLRAIIAKKDSKAFVSEFSRLLRQFRKSELEASLAKVYAKS
ncbi:MAG: prephenate dehydrogenase/arogenate dehydrogenase family protein [Nitrososphaerota archaeon]|nr:prephenate dehydrogenase/arogenate dehydrogenase family protein [Nitrososphaerota archaeon]MDG6949006.1 prephenate dehydrogenase/arogenate dehydrogenase family protein [Nitrososphaerota archaeon]